MWLAARAEMRPILALAVPIVLGLSASTLIGVTDSIMVAPLGSVPLAAVGLTGGVALIIYAAIYGMLSALSVRIGAAWGAGEDRRIPLILRNGLALGALAGLGGSAAMGLAWLALPPLRQPPEVLAVLPGYWACMAAFMVPFALLTVFKASFEAVGRPWLGTGLAFAGVVVNVPLNWVLIHGAGPVPALGLTGAGVASVTAETVGLALAWALWSRAPSLRRLRLRRPLSWSEMGATAREGAPLGALYAAETGAIAVKVLLLGTFGTVALAAQQVTAAVTGLLYMVPLGVTGAVAIRVAQAVGAGRASIRAIALAALTLASAWLLAAAALLVLGGEAVAGAISDDPAVVALAASFFLVAAPMQVADGVQSTMLGALRGLSDTAWPAWVSMAAYWGVALPLGWALAVWAGWGPVGVWMGFAVALAGAGALLTWRFLIRTALPPPPPAGTLGPGGPP